MKSFEKSRRMIILTAFATAASFIVTPQSCLAADAGKLIPLEIKLPAAAFKGTPPNIQTNSYTEPYSEAPPAPLMVPADAKNLAPAAKLSTSSSYGGDKLAQLVDGDKEASAQSIVILKQG